ncbi:RNA polymerase sigma-70 factor [Actinokineospora cianjurensis]|uniref:RNA polymerase ECF family sigma subunit n=1 Tax=Actinokineospora cianjurensis TaxID=585224 RepID=A0A421BCH1_9PSEU|nr:RNA polymerase sigma-70 factor [Actinokineospora cianjurensis]RLK62010.1 RNA polymerase ECF family sigma subunit [Actinokineospora cianjurensis]
MTDLVAGFEAQRGRLFALAYRLLGSAAEAEDVVQDAFLRWNGVDRDEVVTPGAWLAKVVTNLCLNRLTAARARRESYIGPWLPEPVLTEGGALGPMESAEQRESVSLALLVVLERLTPTERAVFVLREAFGYSHREIADVLDVTEANSAQVYRRARAHLDQSRRRLPVDRDRAEVIARRFLAAAATGDLAGLEQVLAADVVSWADGGGKVHAARRPVRGATRVARYLAGWMSRPVPGLEVTLREVNGEVGIVAVVDGTLWGVVVFEVVDDRISTVHALANPEKLAHFAARIGAA